MRKPSINNKLFKILANQRYQLVQKKYPEINQIFNMNNNDLSFIDSSCAHQYLKKCKSQFNRKCQLIEQTYQEYVY